jgi:hypothetical protein
MKISQRMMVMLLVTIGLLGILVACSARPVPVKPKIATGTPVPVRGIGGLPTGAALTPVVGFYASSGMPTEQIPPTRTASDLLDGNHSMGADCITILGNGGDQGYTTGVWEDENNYDWSIPDGCLTAVAAQTITLASGVVVSQPLMMFWPPSYMDYGARWTDSAGAHDPAGTGDNPYGRLHFPAWMEAAGTYSFTYTSTGGKLYQGPTFDGAFKTAMLEIIADGGARYTNNPQLVAIRANTGLAGETLPCCANNCGNGETFAAVEAGFDNTVTCAEYALYVKDIVEALYAAFPNQLILMQSCTSPCSSYTSKRLVSDLITEWSGEGKTRIGIGHNCVQPDSASADERTGNVYANWRNFSAGPTIDALGMPVAFEDANSYDTSTPRQQLMYWMALLAAGASGDIFSFMTPILTDGYINQYAWEVNDYWFGSDTRAWAIFRDREYPTLDYSTSYGDSGYIGDFTKHITVRNPQSAPQVCAPVVKATAVAANTAAASQLRVTPACPGVLPTPVSTALAMDASFNRQGRALVGGSELFLALDSAWSYYGSTRAVTVTLSYLDLGLDNLVVRYPNASNVSTAHTVRKTDTGLWLRATFSTTMKLSNVFDSLYYGSYALSIYNTSGMDYVHELFVDVTGIGTSPSPLVTPTSTPTPVATLVSGDETMASVGITAYNANVNYGDAAVDTMQYVGGVMKSVILLKWPNLTKPSNGYTYVQTATLTLYATEGVTTTVNVYAMQNDWHKLEATWNRRTTTDTWVIPGALDWLDRGTLAQTTTFPTVTTGTVVTITLDVTANVRGWLDDLEPNYGWGFYPQSTTLYKLAGSNYTNLVHRPYLTVTFGIQYTPTPTYTPTSSPTLVPSVTPTATGTRAASATPVATSTATVTPSGTTPTATFTPTPVRTTLINEVCNYPLVDNNRDGTINAKDRALELLNWGVRLELYRYRLEFSTSETAVMCNRTADTGLTYILPRSSYIPANGYKVIYGSDLKDPDGTAFTFPIAGTVALCDTYGQLVDFFHYNAQLENKCWGRVPNGSNTILSNRVPTLGVSN